MEIERSSAMVAKKFMSMMRIVLLILKKEFSKSRMIISDLHLTMKRWKLAGKTIVNLMQLHHGSGGGTGIAHSNSIVISPEEYEFSCSNSPAFPALQFYGKRRHKHSQRRHYLENSYSDVTSMNAMKKVMEMLNKEVEAAAAVEASPMVELPGFGKSPMVKKLRVTDSPFPLKDDGGDGKVDEAAEAFIRRFYSNLKQQTRAALESPSPYHDMWGR